METPYSGQFLNQEKSGEYLNFYVDLNSVDNIGGNKNQNQLVAIRQE